MASNLTCDTCCHWKADPGAYVGDCGMQVVYHRPPFDYAPPDGPCRYHSELGKAPVLSQQSQTRGLTALDLWQKAMGKP